LGQANLGNQAFILTEVVEGEVLMEKQELVNSIEMKFRYIPPSTFWMGSPEDEPGRSSDEFLHRVTITQGFYLGVTAVTQTQFQKVMGYNPSHFQAKLVKGDSSKYPVEMLKWDEAVSFCKRLADLPGEKERKRLYRLPTEAEWEYACRAGTTTMFSFPDHTEYFDYCWCGEDLDSAPLPVASRKPNPWGLYDMHGNVCEFVADYFGELSAEEAVDPKGPSTGEERIIKGGGWSAHLDVCRSACRISNPEWYRFHNIGFRVLLEIS
jgi:formylglycine-generating enzyme required for sulfatase activity